MLLQPLLDALFQQLVAMPPTDELVGWATEVDHGAGFDSIRAFGARATARDARYSGTQCGGDRECGLGQRVDLSAHAAQFIAGLLGCAQNIIRGHLSRLDQRP